jgi:hypothetical protein
VFRSWVREMNLEGDRPQIGSYCFNILHTRILFIRMINLAGKVVSSLWLQTLYNRKLTLINRKEIANTQIWLQLPRAILVICAAGGAQVS